MKFPRLFRKRQVTLPTLWGWLLILALLAVAAVYTARNIAVFLAVDAPVGGDYLVIEGWLGTSELRQAKAYFELGGYERAVVVGGPISDDFHDLDTSFAERAAAYLLKQGLPRDRLAAVISTPYSAQQRTFLNAVMTRDWFGEQGIEPGRLDVFTSDVHARRSLYLYQLAYAERAEIGVIPAQSEDLELRRWWRSSAEAKRVAVEFVGWLMVRCCFTPGEPGSPAERWGGAE